MPETNTPIFHLESARGLIQDEQGAIQVVGRTLTPEEDARLAALAEADTAIGIAIKHLSDQPGPGGQGAAAFLPDGRYKLKNNALEITLRIDTDVCKIVSGDVFALAGGSREYLLSFRTAPGHAVNGRSTDLLVIGEDAAGKKCTGRLRIISGKEQDASVSIRFEEALRGFTPNHPEQVNGSRESSAMRTLGIEIEHETGAEGNPQWTINGTTLDILACFEKAGFDARPIGHPSEITEVPANGWDNSQLHGLMSDYAQASMTHSDWELHLLMLNRATNSRLLGIMFDTGNRDTNMLPRQGAAVFQDPMQSLGANFLRKLLQTSVHELGHALNLAHPFEREIGRADSTSFMNYDWKFMGGGNVSRYWEEFEFTFNEEELAFLRHGRRAAVIPGGEGFHTVPYWVQGDGGHVPYIPDQPGTEFSLGLTTPDNDGLFSFGQPVLLTITFQNNLEEPFTLPTFYLDPKAGFLSFVVNRIEGSISPDASMGNVFRPIVMRCYDFIPDAADLIPSGGTMSNNLNLTYGSSGFTFAEPGEYMVTARLELWFQNNVYRTLYSQPLRIRVAYPKTDEEELIGMNLFQNDIGRYFALGGSDVLSKAESDLREIEARIQGKAKNARDGLVANIRRSRAINMAREFIRFKDGKYQRRPADSESAQSLLSSIGPKIKQFFDPATAESTKAMV